MLLIVILDGENEHEAGIANVQMENGTKLAMTMTTITKQY